MAIDLIFKVAYLLPPIVIHVFMLLSHTDFCFIESVSVRQNIHIKQYMQITALTPMEKHEKYFAA